MNRLARQAHAPLAGRLALRPDEDLVILWDRMTGEELVDASFSAAQLLGARPFLVVFDPPVDRPVAHYCRFVERSVRGAGGILADPLRRVIGERTRC